jgi:hypothetical protein
VITGHSLSWVVDDVVLWSASDMSLESRPPCKALRWDDIMVSSGHESKRQLVDGRATTHWQSSDRVALTGVVKDEETGAKFKRPESLGHVITIRLPGPPAEAPSGLSVSGSSVRRGSWSGRTRMSSSLAARAGAGGVAGAGEGERGPEAVAGGSGWGSLQILRGRHQSYCPSEMAVMVEAAPSRWAVLRKHSLPAAAAEEWETVLERSDLAAYPNATSVRIEIYKNHDNTSDTRVVGLRFQSEETALETETILKLLRYGGDALFSSGQRRKTLTLCECV